MIDYLISNYWLIWLITAMLCLIIELNSGDLYIVCLAIGSIAALLTALVSSALWLPIVMWAIASLLSIWFIRPHLLQRLHSKHAERCSNADALIGRIGIMVEPITTNDTGYVQIDGDVWKAVSHNKQPIDKGVKVEIVSRESIIVTVKVI